MEDFTVFKTTRKLLSSFSQISSKTILKKTLILGLMIGSIYAVFMGPTTLEIPKAAMNFQSFSWVFFIIGGALILLLEKSKDLLEKKSK